MLFGGQVIYTNVFTLNFMNDSKGNLREKFLFNLQWTSKVWYNNGEIPKKGLSFSHRVNGRTQVRKGWKTYSMVGHFVMCFRGRLVY